MSFPLCADRFGLLSLRLLGVLLLSLEVDERLLLLSFFFSFFLSSFLRFSLLLSRLIFLSLLEVEGLPLLRLLLEDF